MRLAVPFALVFLLLLGCSSAPAPDSAHYLMRAPEAWTFEGAASPRVGLRRISVAPYLQNPGLVLETAPGQVRVARYHTWAEPLDQGLRRYLVASVSTALGESVEAAMQLQESWRYAVDLYVDQLHGTADGEAQLVASFRLIDMRGGGEVARRDLSVRAPLAQSGYPALAEAELALVAELSDAIAAALRTLVGP